VTTRLNDSLVLHPSVSFRYLQAQWMKCCIVIYRQMHKHFIRRWVFDSLKHFWNHQVWWALVAFSSLCEERSMFLPLSISLWDSLPDHRLADPKTPHRQNVVWVLINPPFSVWSMIINHTQRFRGLWRFSQKWDRLLTPLARNVFLQARLSQLDPVLRY